MSNRRAWQDLAAVRYGWLPARAGWVTLLLGVLLFTPVGFWAILAAITWILVVSIVLYMGESSAEAARPPAPEPPGRLPPPGVPST